MDSELPRPRVALASLGCKLNQAEVQALARRFTQAGYSLAQEGEPYDIFVLNTCAVTRTADRKSRHLLRLAQRRQPQAFVVATGCGAQRSSQSLASLIGRGLVVGNEEKEDLVSLVAARLPPGPGQTPPAPVGRTRALVKIQSGCALSCAYCIVPRLRGQSHSIPPDTIVAEAQARHAEGCQEVALTGTWPSGYERGRAERGQGRPLEALLKRLLAETAIPRLRLPSLFPQDLTEELMALFATGRLCRHLHLPLQSGSEAVLRRMGRPYTAASFRAQVERAQQSIPGLAITTDVIAAFPGESEAEFQEGLGLCRALGLAAIHVFPFSPRPGTRAAALPGQVAEPVKKERARHLRELSRQGSLAFRKGQLGQRLPALWEGEKSPSVWSGLTDNYLRVMAPGRGNLRGRVLPVRLLSLRDKGIWGELEP
ncbi:MAG: MiaB/RimO family radical SAM methylthiotransferase [Chloroflexi bacterium]|nr:MiaB/RimO family radical SAM methylthiotransferase [Chloroflexota bacterium]